MSEEKKREPFVIFGLPQEVKGDYIAYGKLYFNNNVAEVMKKGMELIKKDEAEVKDRLDTRVTILEERIAKLEKEAYNES